MGWHPSEYGECRRRFIIKNADPILLCVHVLRLADEYRYVEDQGSDSDDPNVTMCAKWPAEWGSTPWSATLWTAEETERNMDLVLAKIEDDNLILKTEHDITSDGGDTADDYDLFMDEHNEILEGLYRNTHLLALTDKFTSQPAKGGCGYYTDAQVTVEEYVRGGGFAVLTFRSGMSCAVAAIEGVFEWITLLTKRLGGLGEGLGTSAVSMTVFGEQVVWGEQDIFFKMDCDDCRACEYHENIVCVAIWNVPYSDDDDGEFRFSYDEETELDCRSVFCSYADDPDTEDGPATDDCEQCFIAQNDAQETWLHQKYSPPIWRKNTCTCLGEHANTYTNYIEVDMDDKEDLHFEDYVLYPKDLRKWPQDVLDYLYPFQSAAAFHTMLRIRHAARVIQRAWRRSITDPKFKLTRKRVRKMFEEGE